MNKTAIKNFAIWARNKLIAEITYKAGLLGITEKEIKSQLPQSTKDVQFFDIGTKEPFSITGVEIGQRRNLAEEIQQKERQSDYKTAYKSVVEEVAYTWFNRLIAVRFMEVNDYLPSRIRVLSSESSTKIEPDLVTTPFDVDLDFSPYEKDRIMQLKNDNQLDELFRMLFIKRCNGLNKILPELFEKTNDYTELLMNVSFTDKEGVVYHLVHDIPEDDFNVEKEGQVEIIGWLYQYYIAEPKDVLINARSKYKKQDIPFVTQLFTSDWIVRYMVENSLGRLWIEGHPNDDLKVGWKYYLDETEQKPEVQAQLAVIREEYKTIKPEDIRIIDPCMGSGHILVYAFDVLMQIYESYGYSQRDAAKRIVKKNLYGLDIDNRAYQLAYFAVMMKARQFNRKILNGKTTCNVYCIQESNGINRAQLKYFGAGMSDIEKNSAHIQMKYLLDTLQDAKEYGSIINVNQLDWDMLFRFIDGVDLNGQISLDTIVLGETQVQMRQLVKIASVMSSKYEVVITNPPYMNSTYMPTNLKKFIEYNYADFKSDTFSAFMIKAVSLCKPGGHVGFITPYVWMFINSYVKTRETMLEKCTITSLIQLEYNAFEAACVPVCTFTLRNIHTLEAGEYIKLSEFKGIEVQAPKTLEAVKNRNCGYRFTANQENYSKIPGMPIAYWVSERFLNKFKNAASITRFCDYTGSQNKTANNEKFVRLWWEIDSNLKGRKWLLYSKGGEYRKHYGNTIHVVDWSDIARKFYKNNPTSNLLDKKYWNQCGIAYTDITTRGCSFRYFQGGAFDMSGPVITFVSDIFYFMGVLNSKPFQYYASIANPTLHLQAKDVKGFPILEITEEEKNTIRELEKQNVSISKTNWDSYETSWDFEKHPLIKWKAPKGMVEDAFDYLQDFNKRQFAQLKANEEELNHIFIDIYSLQDELIPQVENKDVTIRKAELGREVRTFISYAVGCMFGRYSLDVDGIAYAGGEWEHNKYTTFIPDKDNIIPINDEEYFEDDIVGLFCTFLKKSFGEVTLEENLDFIAKALGNKGNTSREVIRNYFLKEFFKEHCKVYQKRPIYWLFESGKSDGFKALVYMHRYNADTIGKLRIEYLHRMQRVYDSEIAQMQETIENSTNAREVAAATKRKEKLTKQLKETKEYDEKIAHLALARISIDLDDGVKVNYEKVQTGTDGKKLEVLAKI